MTEVSKDITEWSLAELIWARSFARQMHWWAESERLNAELKRRRFTA